MHHHLPTQKQQQQQQQPYPASHGQVYGYGATRYAPHYAGTGAPVPVALPAGQVPQGGNRGQQTAQQQQQQQAPQQQQQGQQQPSQQAVTSASSVWAKFEKGDKIGEGTYGWVYHARSKENGGRFAIKQFKGGREGDGVSPTAIREIMLLRDLSHPNIVKLESVHINRQEPSLWLAFEYAEYDLYEMIKFHRDNRENRRDNPQGLMPQYVVKTVMWQLLNGLSYIHQHWVVHRDLKVKIADFGLARIFQQPVRPLSDNGVVVTIWYRAPELLLGAKHYTRAVDVWAAGCIFAELLTLKPIFQGQERKNPGNAFQAEQLDKIFRVLGHPTIKAWPELEVMPHWVENSENIRVKRPDWAGCGLHTAVMDAMRHAAPLWAAGSLPQDVVPPAQAFDLMARMLDYNPSTRITAEEALQHEWFKMEPRPGPNTFKAPGAAVPAVRYPRRPMTINHATPQPAEAAAQQVPAGPAVQQPRGAGPSGPARGSMGNAVAMLANQQTKRRKVENVPGFR